MKSKFDTIDVKASQEIGKRFDLNLVEVTQEHPDHSIKTITLEGTRQNLMAFCEVEHYEFEWEKLYEMQDE